MLAAKKCKFLKLDLLVLALFMGCLLVSCTSKTERALEKLDLGQKYLIELNYTEAILSFTEAINLDPENISAYIGRAEAYRGTEQYENAQADYTVVIEKTMEQPYIQTTAYVGRAEVFELLEKPNEALADYETAASILETADERSLIDVTADALKALKIKISMAYSRLCKFLGLEQNALSGYTKTIDLDDSNILAYLNRAELYAQQGEWEKAKQDCATAVTLCQNQSGEQAKEYQLMAYQMQSTLAGLSGDWPLYSEAQTGLLNTIKQVDAAQLETYDLTNEEKSKVEHLQVSTPKAVENIQTTLEDVMISESDEAYVLLLKKACYDLQGESPLLMDSKEILQQMIRSTSVGSGAFYRGDYAEAERLCTEKIQQNAQSVWDYRMRAIARLKQGNYDLAAQDIEQIISLAKSSDLTDTEQMSAMTSAYQCRSLIEALDGNLERSNRAAWQAICVLGEYMLKAAEELGASQELKEDVQETLDSEPEFFGIDYEELAMLGIDYAKVQEARKQYAQEAVRNLDEYGSW